MCIELYRESYHQGEDSESELPVRSKCGGKRCNRYECGLPKHDDGLMPEHLFPVPREQEVQPPSGPRRVKLVLELVQKDERPEGETKRNHEEDHIC